MQGHAYGVVCSRNAAGTPRVAVDQEAREERLLTTKSRHHQKSQERKERGERSWWWGNHHAHSPDAVRSVLSKNSVTRSVPTLMPLSRPNTTDFIAQQLQILATMQAEQEQRERQQQNRRVQRPGGAARIPDVPAVPEIPP